MRRFSCLVALLGFALSFLPNLALASSSLWVEVLDEETKKPISGALIRLDHSIEDLLLNRSRWAGLSDYRGRALFPSFESSFPISLSVQKEGYTQVILGGLSFTEEEVTVSVSVSVRKLGSKGQSEIVGGQFQDWKAPPRWGRSLVQTGLVIKSLSVMDLVHFDLESFVSPLKDEINLLGRREVPSNLVFPDQRVRLPIGSVRLNKPHYRLPLRKDLPVSLVGVQANVGLSEVLSSLNRGKRGALELLNELEFERAEKTGHFIPAEQPVMNLSGRFPLQGDVSVRVAGTPGFRSDVLLARLTDFSNDRTEFLPTDVKLGLNLDRPFERPVHKLKGLDRGLGFSHWALAIALSETDDDFSGVFQELDGHQMEIGGFMEPLSALSLDGGLRFQPFEDGTFSVLIYRKNGDLDLILTVLPGASAGEVLVSDLNLREGDEISSLVLDFGQDFDRSGLKTKESMKELRRFSRSARTLGDTSSE
jgi:hypothetical protein